MNVLPRVTVSRVCRLPFLVRFTHRALGQRVAIIRSGAVPWLSAEFRAAVHPLARAGPEVIQARSRSMVTWQVDAINSMRRVVRRTLFRSVVCPGRKVAIGATMHIPLSR